jgi:hypothetical protein
MLKYIDKCNDTKQKLLKVQNNMNELNKLMKNDIDKMHTLNDINNNKLNNLKLKKCIKTIIELEKKSN